MSAAAEFDLLVRGGTLATAEGVAPGDIGIRDGRIAAIGEALGRGTREIDARGRLALPGGVDTHCHLEQISTTGTLSADDFFTGSRAAAFGGTTTIVPFASQARGQAPRDVVAAYHARAAARAAIDYAFHIIVSDPTPATLAELPELIGAGHRSIKVFMCYEHRRFSDRLMLELMRVVAGHDGFVMVHAENHDACEFASARLIAEGKTEPRHQPGGRPIAAEAEATHRILALAEIAGAAVLVAHVTSARSLAEVTAARGRGAPVAAETCPHYLVLTEAALDVAPEIAARRLCSPPLRRADDQAALWQAIADGRLGLVTSDHAPTEGAFEPARPFTELSNGLPGLETRLPILFSEGVGGKRITLPRFVELTATNPAKLFGLHPRKGTLAVGADADLALWEPDREVTIRGADLHGAVDHTPFEGMRVKGWPTTTIARGRVLVEDGRPDMVPGSGSFLPQGPSSLLTDRFP